MTHKMILITNLDVWLLSAKTQKCSAGNQSLYNTLLGYARAGWEVHMLTNSTLLADMPAIHDKVFIYRKPMFTSKFFSIFKAVKKKLCRNKLSGTVSRESAGEAKPPSKIEWLHSQVFSRVMSYRAVKLARKLGGVDLIYGHEISGAIAGEKAAKKIGVPLVTRFQGTELCRFLDDPEKLLSYKTSVRALTIDADMVIMTNDGTQGDKVLDILGVPKDRYRFYMNGIVKDDIYNNDADILQIRKQTHIPDENLFFLHAGRLFHWKRIDRLLKVFAKVIEQFHAATLVLIGDGPERKACEQLVVDLGITSNVIFLGTMPHSEVISYLRSCDIYISCYDLSNLSNGVLESCICGKCVVTTDVGGINDLLTNGLNAIVADKYDDIDYIAQEILRVLQDPDERARLASNALQRGAELKTWKERMCIETDEIHKMLAGRITR